MSSSKIVILDKNSLLDDPVEVVGSRLAQAILNNYPPDKIILSREWYDWILKYWPNEYLGDRQKMILSSKLKPVFNFLRLPDLFEKKVIFNIPEEEISELRARIIDTNKIPCYGWWYVVEIKE